MNDMILNMILKLEANLTLFVFVLLDKYRGILVHGINRYLTLSVHLSIHPPVRSHAL